MKFFSLLISLVFLSTFISCKSENNADSSKSNRSSAKASMIYCGTYTKKEGHVDGIAEGVHIIKQSPQGSLEIINTISGTVNPSFIALSANGRFLYAVSETGVDVDTSAYVDAYRIEEDSLILIDHKPTFGHYACHVSVNENILGVSNYLGGTVVNYKINEDGTMGEVLRKFNFEDHGSHPRQDGPHPHSLTFSPDGRCAYVCDLGADRIYQFGLRSDSLDIYPLKRRFVNMSKNSGPRHMVFHPKRDIVYILNELENRVVACNYDSLSGNIQRRTELPTLPIGYNQANTAADIHVTPDGKFLYASNRGHGTLAIYKIEEATSITFVDFQKLSGETPRSFMISKDGRFIHVALQNMSTIESFEIQEDGRLKQIGLIEAKTPVCLVES